MDPVIAFPLAGGAVMALILVLGLRKRGGDRAADDQHADAA